MPETSEAFKTAEVSII